MTKPRQPSYALAPTSVVQAMVEVTSHPLAPAYGPATIHELLKILFFPTDITCLAATPAATTTNSLLAAQKSASLSPFLTHAFNFFSQS